MSDLVSRLLVAIEETERIARAACDERASADGEHWHWVYTYVHDPRVDQPVDIEACNAYLGDDEGGSSANVSLRSIEEYQSNCVGNLPHFAIMQAEEQEVGPARHIAHNDPAAVLRRCAADHRVLERHSYYTRSGNAPNYELTCRHCSSEWPCEDLTDLADRYGISVEEETTGE